MCLILDYFGLIKYEVNSLLGFSHLVDYISVHIRSDLERYLLISHSAIVQAGEGGDTNNKMWRRTTGLSKLNPKIHVLTQK